jgi:hypothetical protein
MGTWASSSKAGPSLCPPHEPCLLDWPLAGQKEPSGGTWGSGYSQVCFLSPEQVALSLLAMLHPLGGHSVLFPSGLAATMCPAQVEQGGPRPTRGGAVITPC